MQAAITQITDSSSYTYRKARLAKQKAIVDLFGDWVTSDSMLPPYMKKLCLENPRTVVVLLLCAVSRTNSLRIRTISNVYSGHSARLLRASRVVVM